MRHRLEMGRQLLEVVKEGRRRMEAGIWRTWRFPQR
jgi:ASC-1-like (ASCH) protein